MKPQIPVFARAEEVTNFMVRQVVTSGQDLARHLEMKTTQFPRLRSYRGAWTVLFQRMKEKQTS